MFTLLFAAKTAQSSRYGLHTGSVLTKDPISPVSWEVGRQTCLSSSSHRWLCELRSGEFGDHLRLVVVLLKQFLNHLCFMARRIILPMAVTAIREYCFPADQYSIPSSVYLLSEPGLFISAIWATAAKVWTTEPAFTSYVYPWALATHDPVFGSFCCFLWPLLIKTDHSTPGTPYESCSFSDVLTQSSSLTVQPFSNSFKSLHLNFSFTST